MSRQGKSMVAFFVMALFIGGSFINSAVMADQIPLTDSCKMITPSGGSTSIVIEVVKGPNGEFPIFDPSTNSYKWNYLLKNYTLSSSKISVLIPYCTNPDIGIVVPDPNGFVFKMDPAGLPGSDVDKANFGRWTDHDNVVTWVNFNANVGPFSLNTYLENPIRQTSMQIIGGNNVFWCPGIKGPDCPYSVNPLLPSTPEQIISIPDVPNDPYEITFKILRHPRSGQITDVQVCGDAEYNLAHNCPTDPQSCCSLATRNDVFGESIHNCTNLNGNQGYQECIIAGTGSPHTQNIVSGTITKVYAYCRTGENKVTVANPFGFECYRNGVPHTD